MDITLNCRPKYYLFGIVIGANVYGKLDNYTNFMTMTYPRLFLPLIILVFLSCNQEPPKKGEKGASSHLVEAVAVTKTNIAVVHTRTGSLRARHEVKIFTQEEGRIVSLPFYEGDHVKKGDIIARLDDKLLRAELNRAQASRHKASENIKRMRDLSKKQLASAEQLTSSETEYEVAKADEEILSTRLSYTTITAPFDGVVTNRLTQPGNIADRYSHLLTIADMSSLHTEVSISELLLPLLKVGDKALVRIDALGSTNFEGHILRIHPSLDPATRLGTIEVELNPVPKGAAPGQLCRVKLETQNVPRLLIPFRALRQDLAGEYVFIVTPENKAQRVAIVSGQRIDEQIEILEGLQEGQNVITKGFLSLKDGIDVQLVSHPDPTG